MEILREVSGEAGVLLWQAYRNVMFWASIPAPERAGIFASGAQPARMEQLRQAELPRDLTAPLSELAGILGSPEATDPVHVAAACTLVSEWATEREHPGTALAFGQAAALASAQDASAAFAVGRMARLQGDHARADTWYRHAVMIARQVGDWDSYVNAYLGLGKLAIVRGNLPLAQRLLVKGLRAARRKGLGELQAMVLHDMFVVATQSGKNENALEFARSSFRHYGADHPHIPRLTHDVAYVWLEQGDFARAAAVFQALGPITEEPDLSLLAYGNLARAAGNLGDSDQFQRAWTEASRRMRNFPRRATVAAVLLEMGMGAAAIGDWERATEALDRAVSEARDIGANTIRLRAESVLESARADKRVESATSGYLSAEQERTADLLADRMVRSLTNRRLIARR